MTQLFLLHRGIKLLGRQYYDVIRRKGEAFEGIEDDVLDGFASWCSNRSSASDIPSTSGSLGVAKIESVDGTEEVEFKDRGTLSDQGMYDMLNTGVQH